MDKPQRHILINFDNKPNLFRLVFCLIAVYLLSITFINFYRFGSIPTDENWFTTTPSKIYITKSFPALLIEPTEDKTQPPNFNPDSIRTGNLILAVNKNFVGKFNQTEQIGRFIPDDSVFVVSIFQLENRKTKYRYLVKKSALPDSFFRILPFTAHVFDVIEGGASDRAGMKVGDLIVRINGENFTDVWEADGIMRSARAGKTVDYEIIRDNNTITLHVTLARFGFDTSALIAFISGILILSVGIFIALKSPQFKAARLVGLFMLMFGFCITASLGVHFSTTDVFVIIRFLTLYIAAGFGIALWLDSIFFFPSEWTEMLHRRKLRSIPYILAAIFISSAIFAYFTRGPIVNILVPIYITIAFVYYFLIHIIFRKQRSMELRKLNRTLAITFLFVFFFLVLANLGLQYFALSKLLNYTILLTLLFPLAYLYTIGRYQLLDINLHMRRNVQYSTLSTFWACALIIAFIFVLSKLISIELNVPQFRLTFTSFEILEGKMPPQQLEAIEKSSLIILSIVLGWILWKFRLWGQKLIDKKYYRSQYDYQHFSRELAEVMATKLAINELSKGIVQKLTQIMNLKRAGILLFQEGSPCCYQAAYSFSGIKTEKLTIDVTEEIVNYLCESRTDSRFSIEYLPDDLQEYLLQKGFRHIIPIWFKQNLNGTLLIGEKLSESPFHAEDLSFFTTVAKQASVSIENSFLYEQVAEKDRMKHELDIARKIQLASLPQKTPKIKGIDIAGISIPAAEVGGDYFDYLNGVPDTVMVIVGDVSGKGTSAALYLFKIQGILRSLYGFDLSPRELFIRANKLLYRDLEKQSFVTAIGGFFNATKKRIVLARAGHLPLFYYHSKINKVQKITPKGLGLGLDEQNIFTSEIEETAFNYSKGDVFLFVTDGITEAKDFQGKEFSEEKLESVLEKIHSDNAEDIRDKIMTEVNNFSVNAIQHDDQTVVVVKAQ
jgi:phosphoserine phosphatase RsbU/P